MYIRILLSYKKEYKVTFWELSYRMSSHSWLDYNSLFNSAAESFYCISNVIYMSQEERKVVSLETENLSYQV